jgi:hypothetical protein
MGNVNKIIGELKEDNHKIIAIAKSKGDKHHLILTSDTIKLNSGGVKTFYNIIDYEHNSQRGSFDGGESLEEAKLKFKEHIKDWNRLNTSLGKLYVVRAY